MVEELFSNELVDVVIDADIPVLKHSWKISPSSEAFRNQLLELQKIFIQKKQEYPDLMWLADTQHLGERSEDDEKWLQETWEKLLFQEASVKVHAVILADDIYSDYSMEQFKILANKRYDEMGVNLGVFMDEASAYEWMKKQR